MLQIEYVKFKNFAPLYVGTGLKEIEIDMSKMKHGICLIIGGNGSGKTSLIESLQPKAYNVGADRNPDLILKDKNGYKEIHYYDTALDIRYIIKHIYSNKNKTKSVKSFLTKIIDGEEIELNPNGNVTSFNEVLELELEFNDTYLSLTRMGPNMRGLISEKPSERKKYMSNILEHLSIYTHYFKTVNEKYRAIKTSLTNVVGKIERLKYTDQTEIDGRIKKLNIDKEKIYENISKYKNELETIREELSNGDIYTRRYDEMSIKINQFKIQKESIFKRMNKIQNINTIEKYIKLSDNINDAYLKVINDINSNLVEITKLNSTKENIVYNIQALEIELAKNEMHSNIDFELEERGRLEKIISGFEEELLELEEEYGFKKGVILKISRDDLVTAKPYVANIKERITQARDVEDMDDYYKYYDLYINGEIKSKRKEFNDYKSRVTTLREQRHNEEEKLEDALRNKKFLNILNQRPSECNIDSCAFISEALEFKNLGEEIKQIENLIDRLDREETTLMFKLYELNRFMRIDSAINEVLEYIKSNKQLLQKLPYREVYIDRKGLTKTICSSLDIEYIDDFDSIISHMDNFERYSEILNHRMPYVQSELKLLVGKIDNYNNNNIHSKNNRLKNFNKDLTEVFESLETLEENSVVLELLKADFDNYKKELDNIEEIEKEIEFIREDYISIQDKIKMLKNLKLDKNEVQKELDYYERLLKPIDKEIDDLKYIRKSYLELLKDKEILEEDFFELDIIRESLSTTKGIPLEYIDMYLKETRILANELLADCFNGELMLENFIINDKEFKMPINVKGYINADSGYASEGQQSLLALAMSFAFIRQNMNKYNIMLLDEVDGPLDTNHRRFFTHTIERQMELIKSNQCYIISHSPEYENYNADAIILDKNYMNKYADKENINIIWSL